MLTVLKSSWALFAGVFLLMLGNGMQGTLLGLRGAIEGFSPATMSLVMAGYFVGFLGGSRLAPQMIRRVGHVRVFAALGSMISAVLILYAAIPDPIVWALLRVIVGFCFSGVYVVAESWLNDSATNETRGQTLSLYLIVQMVGIVTAQLVINTADPGGFILFVIPSVLVSIAFAPLLLSVSPAPVHEIAKPMTMRELWQVSPLGVVGAFLLGGIFAAQFGMAPVYGTSVGMSVGQLSIFIATIYLGGMLCQYPIGWVSDRMDRRLLILWLAIAAAAMMGVGAVAGGSFPILLVVAFGAGGISNPLYSLFIAYTNDYLDQSDMAAASGGLIFANGIGAIAGPVAVGWLMSAIGPAGFFIYMGVLFVVMAGYAGYRMTQRAAPSVEDTSAFAAVAPVSSVIAVEAAMEEGEALGGEAAEDADAPADGQGAETRQGEARRAGGADAG